MDLNAELELMATNACEVSEVSPSDAERWQCLFSLTKHEAMQAIEGHRNNLSRPRISDEQWISLCSELEADGYDREAYEYSLALPRILYPAPQHTPTNNDRGTYLVRLEGLLETSSALQHITGDQCRPPTSIGHDPETGSTATFCTISGSARNKLVAWLSIHAPTFKSTIIRLAKASKDLSSHSLAPHLGIDTTLPHHRPGIAQLSHPMQDEYPVYYFFYGTLTRPDILSKILDKSSPPNLQPAYVTGGRLATWGNKYRALVDDFYSSKARVYGAACLIESQEQEDALMFYETDTYEVARCKKYMQKDKVVDGLTFRFAGTSEALTYD